MRKSIHAYVRFLNLTKSLSKEEQPCYSKIKSDAIAVLAFVSEQREQNASPTVTKIVQEQRFGSLPTLLRRLNELETMGLIEYRSGLDKRLKLVIPTERGEDCLRWFSRLMHDALGSES